MHLPRCNVLFRLGTSAAQRLDPALASKTKSYAIDVRHMETFILETVAKTQFLKNLSDMGFTDVLSPESKRGLSIGVKKVSTIKAALIAAFSTRK